MSAYHAPIILILNFLLLPLQLFSASAMQEFAEELVSSVPVSGRESKTASSLPEISKVQVWMSVPVNAIPLMAEYGILNQFQTGTSQASFSPTSVRTRLAVERKLSPLVAKLSKYPTELHPKSGFLYVESPAEQTSQWSGNHESVGANYANTYLIFKDSVFGRATYTMGDSLQHSPRYFSLNDLFPLRNEIKNGGRADYYETQLWGPLTLGEVSDVYLLKKNSLFAKNDANKRTAESLRPIADKFGISIWEIEIDESGNGNLPFRKKNLYSPNSSKTSKFEYPSESELIERYRELAKQRETEKENMTRWAGESRSQVSSRDSDTALEMRVILDSLVGHDSTRVKAFLEELLQSRAAKEDGSLKKYLNELLASPKESSDFFQSVAGNPKASAKLKELAGKLTGESKEKRKGPRCRIEDLAK